MVKLQKEKANHNTRLCGILFSFIPAPKFNTTLKNHMIIIEKLTIPRTPVDGTTEQ